MSQTKAKRFKSTLTVIFEPGQLVHAVIPAHLKGGGGWHVVKLIETNLKRGVPVSAKVQPLKPGSRFLTIPYSDIKPID